jgi:hypothetical protein
MPSRNKAAAGTPAKGAQPGAMIQSSPLKMAVHKFLQMAGTLGAVKEESERMTKAGDMKVPTLYIVFNTDEDAHKSALAFVQFGEDFGGTADELLMCGCPKLEADDNLIAMFQFIPREAIEIPLAAASPRKAVKTLLAELPEVTGDVVDLPVEKDQPPGVAVYFETEEEAALVAWQYMATDAQDGDKQNPLYCVGEKDDNTSLAFYLVAG